MSFQKILAVPFSISILTPARFSDMFDSNNGISGSTTSVLSVTSLSASNAGS